MSSVVEPGRRWCYPVGSGTVSSGKNDSTGGLGRGG
jgi:hypothetical protein